MDFSDPAQRAAFFTLHSGLPREGPGDRDGAVRALELAGPPPAAPQVLDLGCGPGGQTIDLAELLPDAQITALDAHKPFLRELDRRAAERGVSERIRTVLGDMARPPAEPAGYDLIWCEGAAYVIGLDTALSAWRPLLRSGGVLAFTEPVWLTDRPPERVTALWAAYPAMRRPEAVRALALQHGYRLRGDFVLEDRAWWTHYYGPLEARLSELQSCADPASAIVLTEAREEIECRRAHPGDFGYLFIVLEA